MAAAPKAEPAANLALEVSAKAKASTDCAPEPKLALAADFGDARKEFAPATSAFRQTAANFSAAYRKACAGGLLRGHALMDPRAVPPDTLFLKNALDANDAAIYRDGDDDEPDVRRAMVLEYPFVPADGANHVPSVDDLSEAIFCAAQGASEKEQEETGRCLVD